MIIFRMTIWDLGNFNEYISLYNNCQSLPSFYEEPFSLKNHIKYTKNIHYIERIGLQNHYLSEGNRQTALKFPLGVSV